jgi:ATP-dependent Clp protease ATP-binding subunit ClpA
VILFDEIEKAHPEVFNILLQVLDNGKLTDAKGRSVNFRNAVIILTSNIGSQFIDRMEKIGFASDKAEETNYNDAKGKVLEALKDHFRPEFLNRLDEIVVFDTLGKDAIKDIVKIQVELVTRRLAEKEIRLELSDTVLEHLAKEGYSPQYGARPLKRLIQTKILTPIASLMVGKKISKGSRITVALKAGEFTFDLKNPRKNGVTDGFVVGEAVEK